MRSPSPSRPIRRPSPPHDWYFYQVNTSESNREADYPGNLGYNRDALVFTLNENSTAAGTNSVVQVTSINMNDLITGNPITPFQNDFAPVSTTNGGNFTLRPTVMHDSAAGDPMWLLYSNIGGGSTINVVNMTNVLSNSPTFTNTSLNVNSYSSVVQPLQPDGTTVTPASGNGADWTHIFKAAEYNNTIVACDNVSVSSTEDDCCAGIPSTLAAGRLPSQTRATSAPAITSTSFIPAWTSTPMAISA